MESHFSSQVEYYTKPMEVNGCLVKQQQSKSGLKNLQIKCFGKWSEVLQSTSLFFSSKQRYTTYL